MLGITDGKIIGRSRRVRFRQAAPGNGVALRRSEPVELQRGPEVTANPQALLQQAGVIALRQGKTLLGGAPHPFSPDRNVPGNTASAQIAVGKVPLRPGDATLGILAKELQFRIHVVAGYELPVAG